MNRPLDALPFEEGMDHRHIDEADITVRYVLQRLSEEEERRFEAHLVECASCQEIVEHDIAFREGLGEQPWQRELAASRQSPGRMRWRKAAALAMAASLLLVASTGLVVQLRRVSAQRDAATTQAADARRGQEKAEQSLAAARLAGAGRQSQAASDNAKARVAPAAVFALAMTRGAGFENGAVTNRLRIGDARWIVLAVDLAKPADSARFTASIRDVGSRDAMWSGGPFEAAAPETLTLAVDAGLLRPGDFVLRLERRARDGRVTREGEYVFRVMP